MKLKYGKEEFQLTLSDRNVIQVLNLKEQEILSNPEDKLRKLLKNPLDYSSLEELILKKKAQKVLIIVSDVTRPTPYRIILPPLLDELKKIGIKKKTLNLLLPGVDFNINVATDVAAARRAQARFSLVVKRSPQLLMGESH